MAFRFFPLAALGLVAFTSADSTPSMQFDSKTIAGCTWWYDNWEGQTCQSIRDWRYGISAADFTRWNPSVGLDCSNWQQLSYCVQVAGEVKSSSIAPSSTKPVSSTLPSATPTPGMVLTGWNSLGCYVDANTLSNKTSKAGGTSLTVDTCESACFGDKYQYAGVKAGTDCWCGSFVGSSWTANQTDCNIPCGGNSTQICGGKSVFNVFEAKTKDTLPPAGTPTPWPSNTVSTSATTSTTRAPTSSAVPTWQAVGCYKDLYPATNRTLKTQGSVSDSSQTPQNCQATCLKLGTLYAGVENGRECWCGNEIQSPANNTAVAESDCKTPCTGNKSIFCGAGARLYLYKYVSPSVPWVGLGCYGEESPRILKNIITVAGGQANNTRQNCITGCDKAGYNYAGLENSGECWCDNQITGKLATDGTAGW